MLSPITSVLGIAGKLGDKLIEDKDKRMEYAFRVQEMAFKQMEILVSQKTYPWLDGLVKAAYASEAIVKGLFRPLASAALFAYGVFNPELLKTLHELGVVGDGAIGAMFAAFPGWMASRHQEKKRKKEEPFDW